jgi:hypothetical protein
VCPPPSPPSAPSLAHPFSPSPLQHTHTHTHTHKTSDRLLSKGEGGCAKLLDHVRARLDEDPEGVLRELKEEPRLVAALARVSEWVGRVGG